MDEINHQLGLDEPPYTLYLRWLYDWRPQPEQDPSVLREQMVILQAQLNLDPNQLRAQDRIDWEQSKPQLEQEAADLRKAD